MTEKDHQQVKHEKGAARPGLSSNSMRDGFCCLGLDDSMNVLHEENKG